MFSLPSTHLFVEAVNINKVNGIFTEVKWKYSLFYILWFGYLTEIKNNDILSLIISVSFTKEKNHEYSCML